jgi:hypothetical protein
VTLLVLSVAVVLVGGAFYVVLKNAGALLASMPVRLPIDVQAEYDKRMKRLNEAPDEEWRYSALGDAALWSVDVGRLDDAEAYARELLALKAKRTGRDWNSGNAVYKAHSTLGRIAIKRGDIAEAERQLGLAATSEGSPQMNTFGPNMLLARDLLATGRPSARQAVLTYLDGLKRIWQMDNGAIRVWRSDIEAGREPNFGANLLF